MDRIFLCHRTPFFLVNNIEQCFSFSGCSFIVTKWYPTEMISVVITNLTKVSMGTSHCLIGYYKLMGKQHNYMSNNRVWRDDTEKSQCKTLKISEWKHKNGHSMDTGNICFKKTQKEDKQSIKCNTETNMTSHTDSTPNNQCELVCSRRVIVYISAS